MNKKLSLLLSPFLLCACEPKSSCDTNDKCQATELLAPRFDSLKAENTNYTTANELLKSLGGEAFTVELPDDLPQSFYVGLVVKHADGTLTKSGRSTISNDNKNLRVLLFPNTTEGGRDYSIISKTGAMRSRLELPEFRISVPAPLGRTVKPDEGLIRFGQTEVSSGKSELEEGNFEITLQITPVEE